jgi:hypothetical protein
VAQQALQAGGVREFGRAAEAAMYRIEVTEQLVTPSLERFGGQCEIASAGQWGNFRPEGVQQRPVLPTDVVGALTIVIADPEEDVGEGGHSIAGRFGEIGAADEGNVVVMGQEHGERPAARSPVQQVKGGLINFVEVRPLLTIHLDVDESFVHHLGGGLIFEGFVGHDMAPMAGRIADG